ncbi:MAG: hypothetical protein MZV63_47170 [Marinilabiliales bacterium]|nr:hypothetical protein [Marinilabiliales bacterium]
MIRLTRQGATALPPQQSLSVTNRSGGTTTYAWTNSTPSIGLAASGSGNIPSFTATNIGTAPVTATITVTPSFEGCAGTPQTFTITVNPTPALNSTLTPASSLQQCGIHLYADICSPQALRSAGQGPMLQGSLLPARSPEVRE